MEHKPFVELQTVADLTPAESRRCLTRKERLARWAEALERNPKRRLRPLHEIEWKRPHERRAVRADDSPLTVAYGKARAASAEHEWDLCIAKSV